MRVERIPTLSDNYTYLIVDETTGKAAIVDAPEAEPVLKRVEESGADVVLVLCTHHHWDHTGASQALARRFDAPIRSHVSDVARIPGVEAGLEEGDTISIGSLEGRVLFVPAHTSGHVAYVFPGAVFTGDCLFAGGCGRLFEGDAALMHEALNQKLARLPDETAVYCGHEYTLSNLEFALTVEPGNQALQRRLEEVRQRRARAAADWHDASDDEMTIPTTIGEEKAVNPFMRVDSPEILARVRERDPGVADDAVSVLAAVRALKDAF